MPETAVAAKLPVGLKRDGTPQKRNNQWTKRKEMGQQLPDRDKDKHRAECAAAMLDQHLQGNREMSATQVQAAKILMDKGKPSLQAVESTVVEPAVMRSEAELYEELKAALRSRPDLTQQALADLAKEQQSPPCAVQQKVA